MSAAPGLRLGATTGRQPDDAQAPRKIMPAIELDRLHVTLRRLLADAGDAAASEARLLECLAAVTEAAAAGVARPAPSGELRYGHLLVAEPWSAVRGEIEVGLCLAASEALRHDRLRAVPCSGLKDVLLVATPLDDGGGGRSVLAAAFDASRGELGPRVAALELFAFALLEARSARPDGLLAAAVVDALAQGGMAGLSDALERLRAASGAERLLLGDRSGHVLAMSPPAARQPSARARAVIADALRHVAGAPQPGPVAGLAAPREAALHEALGGTAVEGEPVGISGRFGLLLVNPTGSARAPDWSTAVGAIAAVLDARRGSGTWLRQSLGSGSTLIWAAALIAASLALLVPVEDRIRADAEIVASERRLLPAQFDGILEESHAEPGDVVAPASLLATLDGRVPKLQAQALEARIEEALRRRDVALREKAVATAELARLDAAAAQAELSLVRRQIEQLQIVSPIGGVVLAGDLADARGAPVRQGDVLFEIAPLSQLRVRAYLPIQALGRLDETAPVSLRLDGGLATTRPLPRLRIGPEAVVREGVNVVPATADIANQGGDLRPGQRGVVLIESGRTPLGVVLFRDAWERARRWLL